MPFSPQKWHSRNANPIRAAYHELPFEYHVHFLASRIDFKRVMVGARFLALAVAATAMEFKVLQYNIFGRPYTVSHDGQAERLDALPLALSAANITFDVATFAEADDEGSRDDMFAAFASLGLNYHTTILQDYDGKSAINGGVVLVSRWPILREDQIVYRDACTGADCLAAKGVAYARVNKTEGGASKVFNVFATHMQAWSSDEDKKVRRAQAAQFKAFVIEMTIPADEPVLMAGDFNVDMVRGPGEVADLLSILSAEMPAFAGDVRFTSDPHTNVLVGRDGAADDCDDGYEASWGAMDNTTTYHPSASTRAASTSAWPPATDTNAAVDDFFQRTSAESYCPCCPEEWLDYVLFSTAHQKPAGSSTIEAIDLKLTEETLRVAWDAKLQPVPDPPSAADYMALVDLSDHFPILATFDFPVAGAPKWLDDGCRDSADCVFRYSLSASCYCDGPGCTWGGVYKSGWDAGADDPVNDNCHYHLPSTTCVCHRD